MVPRRGTGIVRTRGGEGSGRRSGGGGGDGGGGIARERKSLLSPTERARDKPKREREGGGGWEGGREGEREEGREKARELDDDDGGSGGGRPTSSRTASSRHREEEGNDIASPDGPEWHLPENRPRHRHRRHCFLASHSSNPFEIDRSAVDRSIVRSRREFRRSAAMRPRG